MNPPRPQVAFSLIELVISMGILSVGLVGAMRVFPMGLRASQRSEINSRSVIAAQRTLESIKLKPWAELADGETTVQEDDLEITTRIGVPELAEPLAEPERLKRIEVRIRAPQAADRVRSLAFATYLRRAD